MASPFPPTSLVTLSMKAGGVQVRVQGAVRVMHPDKGMGVEFTQATPEHRAAVEKFLGVLTANRSLLPELLVEPEGLQSDSRGRKSRASDSDDPLLQLFSADSLTADEFHEALRKQRGTPSVTAAHA
jgi:hypothetical protein